MPYFDDNYARPLSVEQSSFPLCTLLHSLLLYQGISSATLRGPSPMHQRPLPSLLIALLPPRYSCPSSLALIVRDELALSVNKGIGLIPFGGTAPESPYSGFEDEMIKNMFSIITLVNL